MHLSAWGVIRLLMPVALAASQTLTVSGVPAVLDEAGETEVTVVYSCPSCTTDFYLRAVFFAAGSTGYFGYEKDNNGTWVSAPGSQCTQYYKVAVSDISPEGTWSGMLAVRADTGSSYYKGPGEYQFKVGRYTPSCSSASVWSPEYTIAVTGPTATPTGEPTNTPGATMTPVSITGTPTSAPEQEVTSAEKPETETPEAETPQDLVFPSGFVILGESTASAATVTGNNVPVLTQSVEYDGIQRDHIPFVVSFALIGCGCALLATATAVRKTDVWKNLTR